ncbi:MAG: prepilin-type N-terminal cleavage/methylation domain-containing protein [Patescibacteria group bacterium]|nr:prepilin-type N-terminal cleavage/methylation domain-containing protein [Patescibacteria group bacterium]
MVNYSYEGLPMVAIKRKKSAGFTLIEVLLASFIFVVTVGAITVLFITSSNVQTQTKTIRDLNQAGRYALEAISRDLKASASSYYSVSDPEVNGDHPTASVNDLKVPAFVLPPNTKTLSIRTDTQADGTNCIQYFLTNPDPVDNPSLGVLEVSSGTSSGIGSNWTCASLKAAQDVTDRTRASVKNITFSGVDPSHAGITQQPYVKIVLNLESPYQNTGKTSEKAEQTLETTITSRSYPLSNTQ